MKAVIQRVTKASLDVDKKRISEIGTGLLVFLGIGKGDLDEDRDYLIKKISNMRIFEDENEKMNFSVMDIDGEILCVSQFTLYASTKKGNRPSFDNACPPQEAKKIYDDFCNALSLAVSKEIKKGIFGADMKINALNDGPVTIVIDSKNRF